MNSNSASLFIFALIGCIGGFVTSESFFWQGFWVAAAVVSIVVFTVLVKTEKNQKNEKVDFKLGNPADYDQAVAHLMKPVSQNGATKASVEEST